MNSIFQRNGLLPCAKRAHHRCVLLTLSVLVIGELCTVCPSYAQSGGGTFLQMQDGSAHGCIDVTKYDVSMMLVSLQAARTHNFFTASKTIGAKFDVKILSKEGREFSFPRGALLSARDITGDIALLPMKFPIMSKYSLVGTQPYVNVSLDFHLINAATLNLPLSAILSFIEFSKSLPLPPNPYVQGVQNFANFAQKIFDENAKAPEEREPVAQFSFDLPSSDEDVRNCPEFGLREGINAVMFSYDKESEDGIIKLDDYSKYCYELESTTGRVLYRQKKENTCDTQSPATILRNPLVAFVVTKWSKNPSAVDPASILRGATSSRPQVHATPAVLTESGADLAIARFGHVDEVTRGASGENVKKIYQSLNTNTGYDSFDWSSVSNGPTADKAKLVREVETAVNLHLCALAGISAAECH